MPLPDGPHLDRLREAIEAEAGAQRALLGGDAAAASQGFQRAAAAYRASWEAAPPGSYGRLIGMLKAAVIAGEGREAAAYARGQIPGDATSPPASYAAAIAALAAGDEAAAAAAAEGMRASPSEAFGRVADAIAALARGDGAGYARAAAAIVADFEARTEHLTGVAIADTALMLERLAEPRGLAAGLRSPLLPPT